MHVYARDGLSYFSKVVKRYLGGTWHEFISGRGEDEAPAKMKGSLPIKQSAFAECREGVQKHLGCAALQIILSGLCS